MKRSNSSELTSAPDSKRANVQGDEPGAATLVVTGPKPPQGEAQQAARPLAAAPPAGDPPKPPSATAVPPPTTAAATASLPGFPSNIPQPAVFPPASDAPKPSDTDKTVATTTPATDTTATPVPETPSTVASAPAPLASAAPKQPSAAVVTTPVGTAANRPVSATPLKPAVPATTTAAAAPISTSQPVPPAVARVTPLVAPNAKQQQPVGALVPGAGAGALGPPSAFAAVAAAATGNAPSRLTPNKADPAQVAAALDASPADKPLSVSGPTSGRALEPAALKDKKAKDQAASFQHPQMGAAQGGNPRATGPASVAEAFSATSAANMAAVPQLKSEKVSAKKAAKADTKPRAKPISGGTNNNNPAANMPVQPDMAQQQSQQAGFQAVPTTQEAFDRLQSQQHQQQEMVNHQQLTQEQFNQLQQQQQQYIAAGYGGPMTEGTPILVQTHIPEGQEQQQRQLKVEDALAYLDKVKMQFGNQPQVYNQFLEIMKNFKAQTINTPGVIDRVSELFRGHNNLILGFNTFLPPGYKIEIPMQPQFLAQHQMVNQHFAGNNPAGLGMRGNPMPNMGMGGVMNQQGQQLSMMGQPGNQRDGFPGPAPDNMVPGLQPGQLVQQDPAQMGADQQAQQGMVGGGAPMGGEDVGNQPMEFDHAINYVTKIKRRFADDAETYKSFLDILHTYQKEQRSIKEVLDQVSELFKDHSDLLTEFTYFLPDAVREKAKQEINRIATQRRKQERKAAMRKKAKNKVKSNDVIEENMKIPQLERKLFSRIKSTLGSAELWGEFLKCLDLFAQEVISRSELITLLSDVFGERGDLLEEFDRLLASRGATDNLQEDAWFSMPLQEIDFAQCRRCTPSYRALPVSYPKPPFSERTALCRSVLNDVWVSVPTGSEDFAFKNMRKNQYEEALFKCEDDRYEIDMIIDSNAATIRRLEPLAKEIETLTMRTGDASKWRYRLDRRTLSAIHLKSIARIYGDHGSEVLELLRKNPAGAIPTILKRLKQKDVEWKQARLELNKNWKDVLERNYYKSLDHRSFYFKQNDKRAILSKQMFLDLKEKLVTMPDQQGVPAGDGGIASDSIVKPHLELEFGDLNMHRHAWDLFAYAIELQMSKDEAERACAVYKHFVHPLFQLPAAWVPTSDTTLDVNALKLTDDFKAVLKAAYDKVPTATEAFPKGSAVLCEYGAGEVLSYDESHGMYKVSLGFGDAFVHSSRVMLNHSDKKTATDGDNRPCFFASPTVYNFFNLYHMIYTRLQRLADLCDAKHIRTVNTSVRHVVDRSAEAKSDDNMEVDGGDKATTSNEAEFPVVLALVHSFIDGSLESGKFEDEIRNVLGASAYFMFTIDKVVGAAVKQMIALVSDVKVIESLRAMEAFQETPSAATLATWYKSNRNVLVGQDVCAVKLRYEPGVLKSIDQQHADIKAHAEATAKANALMESSNNPDSYSLPSELISLKDNPKPCAWERAPKLQFQVVDTLPATLDVASSETPPTDFRIVEPMQVDFVSGVEAIVSMPDSSSKSYLVRKKKSTKADADPQAPQDQSKFTLLLPVFRQTVVPVDKEVCEVVKNVQSGPNAPGCWFDAEPAALGVGSSNSEEGSAMDTSK